MTFNGGKKQWHIRPGASITPFIPLISYRHVLIHAPDRRRHGHAPRPSQPERLCRSHGLPPRALHREPAAQAVRIYLLTGLQAVSGDAPGVHGALFLVHSEIWRRFGSKEDHGEDGWLELFETDRRSDIDMVADRFVPSPRADSKGIRIKVCK